MICIGFSDISSTPRHPGAIDVFRTAVIARSVDGEISQGAHACSNVIRGSGSRWLVDLERGRSEFGSDARVHRRFEQFTATTSGSSIASTRRYNSSGPAMPLRAGTSSPLSRSDGWQSFALLELENGLVASGSTAPGAPAIEECHWPGHAEGAVLRRGICAAESCGQSRSSRQIDPNEGVDQFGHATQAIGPKTAALICPLDRSDDEHSRAPYAALAVSSAG
jgi:hypothetical protein